jgi:hypothetical protein
VKVRVRVRVRVRVGVRVGLDLQKSGVYSDSGLSLFINIG